jgi:membrane fusion protein (multidrug efflux system)
VAGRVTDINLEEGAAVRRGEVLIELDDDVENAELRDAEAVLALARANFERARDLRRSNAGTQRALDEAQAALRRSEAALALAQARLAKRWIKAPFNAQAGLRQISLGDYLDAGDEIVNLEQIDPLKVDFRVPEIYLAAVAVGRPIAVTIDAFPGEAFAGSVLAINPLIDAAGRAIVIRAQLPNPDRRLRPGLFARVELTLAEQADAVFVREQALVPQGGRQFVYRLMPPTPEGKLTVQQVEVTLGRRLIGEVEVVRGLGPGDRVVVGGVLKVREGAEVSVLPSAEPVAQERASGGTG